MLLLNSFDPGDRGNDLFSLEESTARDGGRRSKGDIVAKLHHRIMNVRRVEQALERSRDNDLVRNANAVNDGFNAEGGFGSHFGFWFGLGFGFG